MADSMCGPSNALQSFQKHSTVDRTLQQDRLIARQSPSQGFRSSPGPNASLLERDFEAFQAGNLPLEHGFHHQTFSHTTPGIQQSGGAAWAADFQRLNILTQTPRSLQSPVNSLAQARHDTGGWHQDFARQQTEVQRVSDGSALNPMASPFKFSPMSSMNWAPEYQAGSGFNQMQNSIPQAQHPTEQFDEEAFARAFDQAEAKAQNEQSISDSNAAQNMEVGQDISVDASADSAITEQHDLLETETSLAQQGRIGADTIHDPENPKEETPDDPDNLAQTAAQLLHSVRHENSSKFQNSRFLELMRQFRDREATVTGDKVVNFTDSPDQPMMSGGNSADYEATMVADSL